MIKRLKILLVEDQNLVRDALTQLLNLQQDFEVVASLRDGRQAQEYLLEETPDLVLTDIEMPQVDGLNLCRWIKDRGIATKAVVLTTYSRAGYVHKAMESGAWGFILKDVPVDVLAKNIRAIAAGQRVFSAELLSAVLQERNPLTQREIQVLRLVDQGLSGADIAKNMCLSEGTVRNYLSECISKLYATSRAEAARRAREKGWL